MDFGPKYKNHWEHQVASKIVVVSNKDTPSGNANEFSVQLPTRIYNALAVKLVNVEFRGDVSSMMDTSGTSSVPKPFVVFVNDYNRVISANSEVDGSFARISSHQCHRSTSSYVKFHNHAGNPIDDSYSYLFTPSTSIDRFSIKIRDESGNPFFEPSDNVTTTLSVFVYYNFSKGDL